MKIFDIVEGKVITFPGPGPRKPPSVVMDDHVFLWSVMEPGHVPLKSAINFKTAEEMALAHSAETNKPTMITVRFGKPGSRQSFSRQTIMAPTGWDWASWQSHTSWQ